MKTLLPTTWRDHVLGFLLAAIYLSILVSTAPDLAMSRDESFYVDAADRYGGWLELAYRDRESAFTVQAIDSGWGYNHEHPALMKSLFALSSIAQREWHVFRYDSTAYRFPGMVTGSLLLWLVYIFGARISGRKTGLFAAFAMATLPRVFYHAHLDCFDVPIAFFLTLTTYAYWRSLTSFGWSVMTGVCYGLALSTKHNAWILPGVFLVHFLYAAAHEVAARRRGRGKVVTVVPWWIITMATIGPAIFVGTWPWLWHDTVARFSDYAAFHLHHDYYNMEYFGRNYFRPPFPSSYAFVMTAFTVPATTLLLALLGLAHRTRALVLLGERRRRAGSTRNRCASFRRNDGAAHRDRDSNDTHFWRHKTLVSRLSVSRDLRRDGLFVGVASSRSVCVDNIFSRATPTRCWRNVLRDGGAWRI